MRPGLGSLHGRTAHGRAFSFAIGVIIESFIALLRSQQRGPRGTQLRCRSLLCDRVAAPSDLLSEESTRTAGTKRVRQVGNGRGVRPPREFRNPSVSSEKVPVRACEWTRVLHLSFPRNEGVPGSSPGVGSSRSRDAPGRFASGLAPLNVLRSSRARPGSRCTTADSVGIAGNEVGNHKGERDQKDDDEGNCGIEQRDHLPNRRFCTFPRHCHR